jgi:glutamate-1-semialdehyde 2,1-aminomutase
MESQCRFVVAAPRQPTRFHLLAVSEEGEMPIAVEEAATTSLLGGISSAFRVNPFVGGHLEVRRAQGAVLETTDGRTYIDMFMAHGTTVLGHAHPVVFQAIRDALESGVVIGYETGLGEEVAQRLTRIIPSAEAVRFVASGSEAVSTAMRLARAHTGRDIIVKIDGHYHGGSDYAMVNSLVKYTDAENLGGRVSRRLLSSGGIPRVAAETIAPVPWNDLPALAAALEQYRDRVAAVIMVPIDFNNGCLTPIEGYLASVRDMTHRAGAVLIFDEVLSGFKTGLGGAQDLYGVVPDVTLLSKALSSGVPLSAIVGRRDVMDTFLKPVSEGGAVQGGTFAGNIIGLAAARATLDVISEASFYPDLLARAARFYRDLQAVFDRSPLPTRVQWVGAMFTVYVGTREPVASYADMRRLDPEPHRAFFARCIERGVYFHTDFSVSAAHSQAVLDDVLSRMEEAAVAEA